jgi:hypothetical protein
VSPDLQLDLYALEELLSEESVASSLPARDIVRSTSVKAYRASEVHIDAA